MPPPMRRPPPSTARPACASARAALPCRAALRSYAALAGCAALYCTAHARSAAFAGRMLPFLPGVATPHVCGTRLRSTRFPAELPELSTQLLQLSVEGVDLSACRQTERADQCFRLLPLFGNERCPS